MLYKDARLCHAIIICQKTVKETITTDQSRFFDLRVLMKEAEERLREYISVESISGRGRGRGSRSRSKGRGSSPSWSQHFDHLARIWDGISHNTGSLSPQQGVDDCLDNCS